ncbi:MAG: hypothetical protein GC166_10485 [Alphaproteobacteria bacterium]|nr:hypothetical protein [Alphaproteobacteria bacterium]
MPNALAASTTASDPRQRIAVNDVQNPMLLCAIALWHRLRGERPFPARNDMTLRDMAPFARNSVLVRVLNDGAEFEIRLVGDAVVEAKGCSFQNMTLTEAAPRLGDNAGYMRRAYEAVLKGRAPIAFRGWIGPNYSLPVFQESVMLPLGPEGESVDHILIVGVYAQGAAKRPR